MKKVIILFVSVVFLLSFTTISFAGDEILVGTGSTKGFYTTKAFPRIAQQTKAWDVKLKAKPGGSRINIKRLLAGEIQVAMVQFDAVIDADNQNILIIGFLHDEVIHALTTWDNKINEFSDIKEGKKVAVGKPTGGSALTWDVWARTVKQLGKVETVPLQGTRAIAALEAGDVDMFFSVTGMGDKYFKQANSQKKKFKLVELDFGALKKLKYKKNAIYHPFEIESKNYPNLIKGFSDPDVFTVKACLVTTNDWADEHEDEFEIIADAVNAARAGIIAASKPKL
jgi:TRAP transporter TAXI family solute receptor